MEEVILAPGAELAPARPQARPAPRRVSARAIAASAFRMLLVLLFFQIFLVQGYRVYGCCMEPNLWTDERLLATKLGAAENVHRGDVVVFCPPHKPTTPFIKRVIGLPGDVLEIRNSQVYVNNQPLREPYLRRAWHDDRAPERVPDHMVFVMGDNRDNSNDSRMWGDLPIDHIQGHAWLRYWPLSRFGVIQ